MGKQIIMPRHTRRKFLRVGAAALLYGATQNGDFSFSTTEIERDPVFNLPILSKHTVPQQVQQVRLDDIIEAFSIPGDIGRGVYTPQFVDLVQEVHHLLTGMTYPGQVSKNYGVQNIIEIIIVKGFRNIDSTNQQILLAKFVHADQNIKRNILYLDSELRYPQIIGHMFHELSHGVNGESELRAYATDHREFAHTIAIYPTLLMEDDSKCPLMNEFKFYVGVLTRQGNAVDIAPNLSTLPYLILLDGSAVWEGKRMPKIDLEDAVKLSGLGGIESFYTEAARNVAERNDTNKKLRVVRRLADVTEQYITSHSPNLSNYSRQLLSNKMERVRNLQF